MNYPPPPSLPYLHDDRPPPTASPTWHDTTMVMQDLWERRDMKLVGVLALREIILALDRERASFSEGEVRPELTAGTVCRQNCFTVKVRELDGRAHGGVKYLEDTIWFVLNFQPLL